MGVITNGSGGGAGGGIRYNATDDTIEVKYNGQWVRVMGAGAQWDGYVTNNGDLCQNITGGYYSTPSGTAPVIDADWGVGSYGMYAKATKNAGGSAGSAICTVSPQNAIDISQKGFTKFHIEGVFRFVCDGASGYNQNYNAQVSFVNNSGIVLKNVVLDTRSSQSSGENTYSTDIDIASMDVSSPIKVCFIAEAYSPNSTLTPTATHFIKKAYYH